LETELWLSSLVQEKYQGEKACDKNNNNATTTTTTTTTIIIIIPKPQKRWLLQWAAMANTLFSELHSPYDKPYCLM